jgi:phosphatidylglycerol---prolipoprotein diacylglyceryl transferase
MHVSALPAGLFSHLGFFVLNIDPIFFHLGPLAVHWYGLAYVVAITVGLWAIIRWALKEGIHEDQIWSLFIWTAIAGLVGGRLYFVIQQPDLVHNYLLNPINIIAVWNGGMAFFGAIFAGTAMLFYLAPRYGMSRFIAIDGGAVFAMVGQIFGRFGNVINGDIVGQAMSSTLVSIPASTCANAPCLGYVANDHILPWAVVYLNPHSFAPTGIPFAPAPIYEMLFNIIALIILIPLQHRLPRIRAGFFFITYLMLYAISQFIVFFYRGSEPITPFLGITGLKQAQWTAVFVFLA